MSFKFLCLLFVILFIVTSNLIGSGCADGWHSSSIGSRGACSHHGGVSHWNVVIGFFVAIVGVIGYVFLYLFIGSLIFPNKPSEKNEKVIDKEVYKPKRRIIKKTKRVKYRERKSNPYKLYNFSQPEPKSQPESQTQARSQPQTRNQARSPVKSNTTPIVRKIDPNIPLCPKCGSLMKFKDKKDYGFNFWGCEKYPSCKGIRQEE